MAIHKYGRTFKSKASLCGYIRGRARSWNTKAMRRVIPAQERKKLTQFWRKEAKKAGC